MSQSKRQNKTRSTIQEIQDKVKAKTTELSALTKVLGILGISAFVFGLLMFLISLLIGFVVDTDIIDSTSTIAVLIAIPCLFVAGIRFIKERQYWTNDPKVMSPLRKFGKLMFFVMVIIFVLGMFFDVSDNFPVTIFFAAIFFLGLWKVRFSNQRLNHNDSPSKIWYTSNISNSSSFDSLSRSIYYRR